MLPVALSRKPNRWPNRWVRQQEAFMATTPETGQESTMSTLVWTGATLIVVAIFAIFYLM